MDLLLLPRTCLDDLYFVLMIVCGVNINGCCSGSNRGGSFFSWFATRYSLLNFAVNVYFVVVQQVESEPFVIRNDFVAR